jgi:antitoxin (DNA-binding transcriptional repressor) of toxin-antitoxin stability system
MQTVGTRELKQNPHTVVQRVLDSGDEFEVTSYGRPTGVRIVPAGRAPRRWVSGAALATVEPISAEGAAAWKADIEAAIDDEITDPWERA